MIVYINTQEFVLSIYAYIEKKNRKTFKGIEKKLKKNMFYMEEQENRPICYKLKKVKQKKQFAVIKILEYVYFQLKGLMQNLIIIIF